MILLPTQLQSLVYMLFMGWGYGLAYSFINRLFYALRHKKIIYLVEIIFHAWFISILFLGLFRIHYGIMNLYLWLAFFLGLYLYLRCYSLLFLQVFEGFMKILRFLLKPLRIAYLKIFAIIRNSKKKRRMKKDAKKRGRQKKKKKVK